MSVLNRDRVPATFIVQPTATRFTSTHLKMLNSPAEAYLLPLAVIALIDMNAFFAQCEQNRLNKTLDDPVVCCQWASLIAVSYAARKYGIGRMDTLQSAKEKCPDLVVGHAAVFEKGNSYWLYLDVPPNQAIHKVSLDPYRRELRKIFKILSRECDLVEKASVDECFLDLGRMVHTRLLELFPQLAELKEGDPMPQIPDTMPELALEGELYPSAFEKKMPLEDETATVKRYPMLIEDWDDVCTILGSVALFKLRAEVFKELKYTTSGGLASTKTVAKLAAGFKKPDAQTIVRPKLTYDFLSNFKLSDISQMGGQTGERIMIKLEAPAGKNSIGYIRDTFSLEDLKQEFPDEEALAERLYELCRGNFRQEVKLRTVVKSMMSRKNFQPTDPVNNVQSCYDWIKVFVGDLYGRLIELDDENLNLSLLQKTDGDKEKIFRPRAVSIQLITTAWSKMSRQTQFPVIKNLEKLKVSLEATAFRLLCELLDNWKATDSDIKYKLLRADDEHLSQIGMPLLANMGVVITNFVTTTDSNLIDSYGSASTNDGGNSEDLKKLFEEYNKPKVAPPAAVPKKLTRSNSYVRKLFQDFEEEKNSIVADPEPEAPAKGVFKEDKEYVKKMFESYNTNRMVERATSVSPKKQKTLSSTMREETPVSDAQEQIPEHSHSPSDKLLKELMKTGRCPKCEQEVTDVFEHRDYHLALDLSMRLNSEPSGTKRSKTQSRLPFGPSMGPL